jgi:hypothetical protein
MTIVAKNKVEKHVRCEPRFVRGESRISFDMLKCLRRVNFFLLSKTTNPKTLKPKNQNPKS